MPQEPFDRYGKFTPPTKEQQRDDVREARMALTFAWASMLMAAVFLITLLWLMLSAASAHDLDHPDLDKWYEGLMQPDNPGVSCCGESDAYWADEIHYRNGKTYAVITDDRPDAPRHRHHVDPGTEIEIPPNKLKWDRGNPTGHGIVFLSYANFVFCYVQPGGV